MTYREFLKAFNANKQIKPFTLGSEDRGEFLRCAEDDGRHILGNIIPMSNGMYLIFESRVVWDGSPVTEWEFTLQ
jgi:hypothetical protein